MNLKQPIPLLWLSLWVPLLAFGWLLPNHYYPWATFHSDAWVAVMLAIAAAAVWIRNPGTVAWHDFSVAIALLATVPFLQFFAGQLDFSGLAWICTAYVLGFLLALLTGARWETATPGRAADGLMLAIGIAALVSVGLQLRQWLGVTLESDEIQIWAGEYSPGRPAANLGQPNQLATLLLWGLMACAWGVLRQKIRPTYAVLMALGLLFGLALTQSRIAMIATLIIMLASWGWRRLWNSRRVPQVVTLLFLYFAVCVYSLQYLSDLLDLGLQIRSASLGGESTHLRLQAYSLFLDAVWQHPWWGYGWNQVAAAQLSVAQNHPNMTSFFIQSHNLFLDLVLWCGIPIGGGISAYVMIWFFRCIKRVVTAEDAILVVFVLAVGLHAMVELPLHHAYLLLPTGLVMGMLSQRQKHPVVLKTGRGVIIGLWFAASILLAVIIRDYLNVDASFRTYRLEVAHVGKLPPGEPPDVLILDDLYEFILNARTDVKTGMDDAALEKLFHITTRFPSTSNMFNYAKALALSGKPAEATAWIEKMQHVLPNGYSLELQSIWRSQSVDQPAMALVPWPDMPVEEKSLLHPS
ncbi:Wzy polymerase domain-containing protein [Rhodoferax sp.]|uniref:PglL family O-oligosaccharyltransferase n=1 Tax=Rhodoferax sp. TaxID=50421 RepID=UPI00374CE463